MGGFAEIENNEVTILATALSDTINLKRLGCLHPQKPG